MKSQDRAKHCGNPGKPNLSFLRSDFARTLILAIGAGVAVLLLLVGLDPLKFVLG
jgi:hypothetical protein